MHIRAFLISLASLVASAWCAVSHAISSIVDWPLRWHEYVPSPHARMQLDRLGHAVLAEPQGLLRYRSWSERLSLHRLFTGGGFREPQSVGTA